MILLGNRSNSPGILPDDVEWLWLLTIWTIYFFTPILSSLFKFLPARFVLEVFISLSFARQLTSQFIHAQVSFQLNFVKKLLLIILFQSWYPEQTIGPIFSAAMVNKQQK